MRLLFDIGQRRKKTSSPVYGLILKKTKKKTEDRNGIRSALAQEALLVDFFFNPSRNIEVCCVLTLN